MRNRAGHRAVSFSSISKVSFSKVAIACVLSLAALVSGCQFEASSSGASFGGSGGGVVDVIVSPSPVPTVTVTASPTPAPTVTVTDSPAPAPTVTVTPSPSANYTAAKVVQSAVSSNVFCSSCTITLSQPVTPGDAILVWMGGQGSNQWIGSATDSVGDSYAVPASAACQNLSSSASAAYTLNAIGSSGPVTITVNTQSAVYHGYFVVAEVSAIAASGALDQATCNANSSATNPSSGSVFTAVNGEYISGFFTEGAGDSGTMSAGAGFTEENASGTSYFYEDEVQTASGSVAATASTSGSSPFAAAILTLEPIGAAPAPQPSSSPSPTSSPSASPTPTSTAACPKGRNCYYISSSIGNDNYDGLSETFSPPNHGPWYHAPGMNGATGNPKAYSPGGTPDSKPGDTFIFRGCDVWTNSNFSWIIGTNTGWSNYGYYTSATSSGANGGLYFLGDYDKAWYNSANCPSGWNRPVFDGCLVSSPPVNNRPGCSGSNVAPIAANQGDGYQSGAGTFIQFIPNYVTVEGFEFRNHYHAPGNSWNAAFGATQGTAYGDIKNNYYHAWIEPPILDTQATISQGSNVMTITGNTANLAIGEPIGLECVYCVFPPADNGPIVSAINGNQVTVTDGYGNPVYALNNDCASSGCTLLGGWDSGAFTAIQGFPNSSGMVFEQNVIDGWDTNLVQDDPGCTNNSQDPVANFGHCLGSFTAFYQGPAIVKNNVIRYAASFYLGGVQEFSGNLIEYSRSSINPTAHSNLMESLGDSSLGAMVHDNVIEHAHDGVSVMVQPQTRYTTTGSMAAGSTSLTVDNPQTFCGNGNCGFGIWWYVSVAGAGPSGGPLVSRIININGNTVTLENAASITVSAATVVSGAVYDSYVWNNVIGDIATNFPMQLGSSSGSVHILNNSVENGPDPDGISTPAEYPTYPFANCPSSYSLCDIRNNLAISCAGTPGSPNCDSTQPVLSTCGSNCAQSNNLSIPLNTANSEGLTISESPYLYLPPTGNAAAGYGTNLTSLCADIPGLCSDTSYGVTYDQTTHTAIVGGRTTNPRPGSGPWDAGAYQF